VIVGVGLGSTRKINRPHLGQAFILFVQQARISIGRTSAWLIFAHRAQSVAS
jgi:hypothetical protein